MRAYALLVTNNGSGSDPSPDALTSVTSSPGRLRKKKPFRPSTWPPSCAVTWVCFSFFQCPHIPGDAHCWQFLAGGHVDVEPAMKQPTLVRFLIHGLDFLVH